MYVSEQVLHYVASFLEHYDIQNKLHQASIKEIREISNKLLERLYKPATISVVRKEKPSED